MRPAVPSTIWLAATGFCNNRCSWCYAQNNKWQGAVSKAYTRSMISLDDAKLAIDTLAEVGAKTCILIGGEPTLHPALDKIIVSIRQAGMKSALVTNGRRAQDLNYAKTVAEAGLDSVTVSMHGWSPDSYEGENNRSQASKTIAFKQAVRGYANLKAVGVHTGINIVLSRSTWTHTSEIVTFVRSLGIHQLGFNIAAPAVSQNSVRAYYNIDQTFPSSLLPYLT